MSSKVHDDAWRAGMRAARRGVPLALLRDEARTKAQRYVARHYSDATPAKRADLTLLFGTAFYNGAIYEADRLAQAADDLGRMAEVHAYAFRGVY